MICKCTMLGGASVVSLSGPNNVGSDIHANPNSNNITMEAIMHSSLNNLFLMPTLLWLM
uniref:Uncharacterized protein n=1 Tax=Rhizophora mucronata TaxID=61149 RepID=A0A2P2P345_RHIMU